MLARCSCRRFFADLFRLSFNGRNYHSLSQLHWFSVIIVGCNNYYYLMFSFKSLGKDGISSASCGVLYFLSRSVFSGNHHISNIFLKNISIKTSNKRNELTYKQQHIQGVVYKRDWFIWFSTHSNKISTETCRALLSTCKTDTGTRCVPGLHICADVY